MKKKLSEEEFVKLAVSSLRRENFRGIHTIYSGFNEAFKLYFGGANPIEATDRLAQEGRIVLRPVKGGMMIFLPGDGPELSRGEEALRRMGLLDKPAGDGRRPAESPADL